MNTEAILTDLERVVHELWRVRMSRSGWQHGPYAPGSKTHDAMVAFEKLRRADRLALALFVRGEGLEESLARLLTYPRGANRPFLKEELRVGLKVVLCDPEEALDSSSVSPDSVGEVTGWKLDAGSEVESVAVRWSDSVVEEYSPWECVLARLEEIEPSPLPDSKHR